MREMSGKPGYIGRRFEAEAVRGSILLLFLAFLVSSCSTAREAARPDSAVVVATFYGKEFNGRPTASGEVFNMYAMTCAHREYPFGTRLVVTNIANDKSVECIVNDRGPFVSGRDLDLSYGSAKEIGLLSMGKVHIEVRGRDESYIRKVKVRANSGSGPFTVQVGSFRENSNASRLQTALRLKYEDVYIQEMSVKGNKYYRVRVGTFDKLPAAISMAGKLGYEGYPTVVVKVASKI